MRRTILLTCALVACGCSGRETTLVVRTTLPRDLRDFVEKSFEAKYLDINLRFSVRDDDESFAEAQAERGASFDVWWGASAIGLAQAAKAGVLQAYRPSWVTADADRANLLGASDGDDRWHVTLVSPYVIAFNREQLPLTRAPRDWIDLFHFRWAEEAHFLEPSTTEDGAYLLGALIVDVMREGGDLPVAFDRLARLDTRAERYVDDAREIFRALESGDALFTILPRAVVEEARHSGADWLHYRAPETGTPVVARGVGIMAGTDVQEAARRFVEHLGAAEVLTARKRFTRWEPSHGAVAMADLPPGFELDQPWTPHPLAIDTLAAELHGWIGRWSQDVRGALR